MFRKLFHSPRLALVLCAALALSTSARGQHHAGPPVPAAVPAAAPRLVVSPPIPGLLAKGVLVLQFQVDALKIMPIYGPAALAVTPHVGHLHVTIDGAPWHWVHASDEPIVIQGLARGEHQVRLDLADANHTVRDSQTVSVAIP